MNLTYPNGVSLATKFGNRDTICADSHALVQTGGVDDKFDLANGTEPTFKTPELAAHLATCGAINFDEPGIDACFGQSFVWNDSCCLIAATLCGRFRAGDGNQPGNDVLYFGNVAAGLPSVWAISMSTLLGVATGGADDWWAWQDTMSFCFDLANLPVASSTGVTSIMSLLHTRGLDVLLQDDSEVDYLKLTLTFCCDCKVDTLYISTGFDQNSGLVMLPPANDPEWQLVVAPAGVPLGPAKVVDGTGLWVSPEPTLHNSQWVSALRNGIAPDFFAPIGVYDYVYNFCIDPDSTLNRRLYLCLRSDNAAEVFLNNSQIITTTATSSSDAVPTCTPVITTGFNPLTSDNQIKVRVHNDMVWTGFDLAGYVTADNMTVGQGHCCGCLAYGDVNGDGINLTMGDLVFLNGYIYHGGPPPPRPYEADLNGDCVIDSSDYKIYQNYFVYGLSAFSRYPVPTCCHPVAGFFVPGDANGDGMLDISDAVYLISYIFAGGPAPNPLNAGDANCDGSVDISDCVYLIAYIFAGGPPPC